MTLPTHTYVYTVHRQVAPIPDPRYAFRVVENMITCDGMRSRLTSKVFSTVEEAWAWCEEKEKALRKPQG